jgi:hypothetical protein
LASVGCVVRVSGQPKGAWRAVLQVRPPGDTWTTVKDLRARFG